MPQETLSSYLEFAKATAWEAGRLTLGWFHTQDARPDFKSDDSPVTQADQRAEALIRSRIEQAYPGHGLVGEEYGESEGSDSHRWIIDPIDGTKSFICGVPLYGVLLALEIEGRCEVGVAYFPALDEMVAAASGLGCSWNGRACRVSPMDSLDRAILAHGDTAAFTTFGKGDAWERLQKAVYYNAGWCDAYGYFLVATGRIHLMLDPIMNVWDCAPFAPIFREAGGYFGDWQGRERIDGGEALGTTQALLGAVMETLRGESLHESE